MFLQFPVYECDQISYENRKGKFDAQTDCVVCSFYYNFFFIISNLLTQASKKILSHFLK